MAAAARLYPEMYTGQETIRTNPAQPEHLFTSYYCLFYTTFLAQKRPNTCALTIHHFFKSNLYTISVANDLQ
jgi:hypothetical protein